MENYKAFLCDKGTKINNVILADNDIVISDEKQLCKTFSNIFQEKVKALSVSDRFNMDNYSRSNPGNNARKYEK